MADQESVVNGKSKQESVRTWMCIFLVASPVCAFVAFGLIDVGAFSTIGGPGAPGPYFFWFMLLAVVFAIGFLVFMLIWIFSAVVRNRTRKG